ncbi:hypothetical protein R3I94_009451 [Phoxinus phoxinus]
MLLFMIILSLTLQPGLSKPQPKPEPKPTPPPEPCVKTVEKSRYYIFYNRHLNYGIPKNVNIGKWQKFIKCWDRGIQSFFPKADHETVESVCSAGGKRYKNNLCISKKRMKFYTAYVDIENKKVMEVKEMNQHVILACDKIETLNKCLPVHFQPNIKDAIPGIKAPNCS